MTTLPPERLELLRGFVARLAYRPGWRFKLGGPLNRFICVHALCPDSLNPSRTRITQHMFEVPDGLADERSLAHWIFDRLLDVERHEAAEFFEVGGLRPFFPNHQDEGSPYEPVERWEHR